MYKNTSSLGVSLVVCLGVKFFIAINIVLMESAEDLRGPLMFLVA